MPDTPYNSRSNRTLLPILNIASGGAAPRRTMRRCLEMDLEAARVEKGNIRSKRTAGRPAGW